MRTWLRRRDRDCDHIRIMLVLDLLRVAGRAEVVPSQGDHKARQDYQIIRIAYKRSPVASRASDDDSLADRVAAALRGGEWKEDNFEKTFASGTISMHFLVNERWHCAGDFGSAAAATTVTDLGASVFNYHLLVTFGGPVVYVSGATEALALQWPLRMTVVIMHLCVVFGYY
jgi:hypothetical protein